MTENERFGLVFAKTLSINSGTESQILIKGCYHYTTPARDTSSCGIWIEVDDASVAFSLKIRQQKDWK
jgi:hypothetical protein